MTPPRAAVIVVVALAACTGGEAVVDSPAGPALGRERLGICDGWDVQALKTLDDLSAGDAEIADIAALGVSLVRPHRASGHVFSMSIVQKGPDAPYDWTLPDHVAAVAGANGLDLFVTLDAFTDEARSDGAPHHLVVSPAERPRFADFVRAIVERYDGDGLDDAPAGSARVAAWELGNEPWCPPADGTCKWRYRELLSLAYEAAHAADADAVVMPGGAAPYFRPDGGENARSVELWRAYFAEPAGPADAFAFHVTLGEREPTLTEQVVAWRTVVGDRPLWLTEAGPYNVGGVPSVAGTPAGAASWLDGELEEARAAGLERVFLCGAQQRWEDLGEVADVVKRHAGAK